MNYNKLTNKPFAVSSKSNIRTPKESKEQEELRHFIEKVEVKDSRGNRTYSFK